MIRVLIVDDEPIARRGIRHQLRGEADLEVIGECGDGAAAIDAITGLAPDLVFLDIQMPEVGGFDVVEAIGVARMPAVVFVTAYDEHALRAFDGPTPESGRPPALVIADLICRAEPGFAQQPVRASSVG